MADYEAQDFQYSNESLDQFATYEDYLDSQLSETDHFYLEVQYMHLWSSNAHHLIHITPVHMQDEELARQLVELGYRGAGETLRREDFEARKKAERERNAQKSNMPKQLASAGKDLSQYPFLAALASREELVRNGKLTVSKYLLSYVRSKIHCFHFCYGSQSSSFETRMQRVKKSADILTMLCD
jgi:hypothetical protein